MHSLKDTYITDHLTKKEHKNIKKLNKMMKQHNEYEESQNPFNLSLDKLLNKWSNNMQHIIREFSETIFLNDIIKDTKGPHEFIIVLLQQLYDIVTKDDRLIYLGFTFIFISFVVYLIHIPG